MGSVQQISLGIICLAAAFAFGNYVNNHPSNSDKPYVENTTNDANPQIQPVGNVRSRLVEGEFDVIDKRPAPIATMRKPLQLRFSVPPTDRGLIAPESDDALPPPSQLAIENESGSSEPQPITTVPRNEKATLTAEMDIPDFSQIAAEFKNTPMELPPLGSMPAYSKPIDNHARRPNNPVPLNNLTNAIESRPAADDSPNVDTWGTQPTRAFSADDFAPKLRDRFAATVTNPILPPASNRIDQPDQQLNKISPPENLTPERTKRSNHVVSRQPVPSEASSRGMLDLAPINEPPGPTRVANNPPSNRVRTMLPFGLTEQAISQLVAIKSDANSKIALNTTQFVDHVIQSGETLQSISTRYFGNPDFYLDIYLANRSKLRNPADTPVGIALRVPVYE